ncbi:hypothetical protein N7454_001240 [Penicillium verhagenii]|nr:hypothetical protein N7454_001240 [Penicillium verhagenii]
MVHAPQAAVDAYGNYDHMIAADRASKPPTNLLNLAAKRGISIKIHDLTEPAFDIRTATATTCGTVMDMLMPGARAALEIIEWPTRPTKRKRTTGLSVFIVHLQRLKNRSCSYMRDRHGHDGVRRPGSSGDYRMANKVFQAKEDYRRVSLARCHPTYPMSKTTSWMPTTTFVRLFPICNKLTRFARNPVDVHRTSVQRVFHYVTCRYCTVMQISHVDSLCPFASPKGLSTLSILST